MHLSNDGTKLYVELSNNYAENKYIGPNNPNLKGHILIIPLDANGVPNIQVNNNGTPGDTSDDFLSNVDSIDIGVVGNIDRANLDVDAAGNIYVSNNVHELLQIFSPAAIRLRRPTRTARSRCPAAAHWLAISTATEKSMRPITWPGEKPITRSPAITLGEQTLV